MEYQAVTAEELVNTLGRECSPMTHRNGYVIGPDINGRQCHIATCFTLTEAKETAKRLNNKFNKGE